MKVKLSEKILTVILLLIAVGALAIKPAQEISPTPLGGGNSRYIIKCGIICNLILFNSASLERIYLCW